MSLEIRRIYEFLNELYRSCQTTRTLELPEDTGENDYVVI